MDARGAHAFRLKCLRAVALWAAVSSAACSVFEPPLQSQDDGGSVQEAAVQDSSEPDLEVVVDSEPDMPIVEPRCDFDVRINEVDGATTGSGSDREFIELFNSSVSAISIGGMHIARSDQAGGPDADAARTIPDGITLAPNAHLYLVAGVSGAEDSLTNDCIEGAPKPCLEVDWDIDEGGDTAFLLSPDKMTILCELYYPEGLPPEESWGLLPDGSSEVAKMPPTPGRTNTAN